MAAQPISTVNFRGPTGRKDERRRDQRVGVLVPDCVLRMPIEHAQHPVMTCEIGEIPRHGGIGLSQRIGAVDQRNIVELGATNTFRLHNPE